MRAVHFVPKGFPKLGGSERQALLLAQTLAARGVVPSILAPRRLGEASVQKVEGIPVRRFGLPRIAAFSFTAGYLWPLAAALRAALREADGIHFHGVNASAVLGAGLAERLGKWSVAKAATAGPEGDLATLAAGREGPERIARAARSINRFIAVSTELKEEMLRFGISAGKIALIPNGVDAARFAPLPDGRRPAEKAALGWGSGTVVAAAGRLVARKRFDAVLRSFRRVREKRPDVRLAILGDGPERGALERLSADLGIAGAVVWHGEVADPERHLAAADVFLHAASAEGLPNAVIEAVACGLPVVAPRIGGIVDLFPAGESGGFLHDPDDEAGAAARLEEVLALSSARREDAARAARERVLAAWSIGIVAARVHSLYGVAASGTEGAR